MKRDLSKPLAPTFGDPVKKKKKTITVVDKGSEIAKRHKAEYNAALAAKQKQAAKKAKEAALIKSNIAQSRARAKELGLSQAEYNKRETKSVRGW